MSTPLRDPILFIGAPRSGTTVLFEAFARHEHLAWPSNHTFRFPRLPVLNLARRITDNKWFQLPGRKPQHASLSRLNRLLPRPEEPYPLFESLCDEPFARSYMLDARAGAACRERLQRAFRWILRLQGRERIAMKLTGPGRIGFLSSVFPGATFVHVLRDGRAVVDSLLRVRFWREGGGLDEPWWNRGLDRDRLAALDARRGDPLLLAALQWATIVETIREESRDLREGRYVEARYEDFVADPERCLSELYAACNLPPSSRASRFLASLGRLTNMNWKATQHLSDEDLGRVERHLRPCLDRLGYPSALPAFPAGLAPRRSATSSPRSVPPSR